MSAESQPAEPFPEPGELLPHRPPMLLLRAVLAHRADETWCEARFDDNFARACGGAVPTAFGLELIAQAAAVHHALRQRVNAGGLRRAERGLLLGSRRLKLHVGIFPVDQALKVIVQGGEDSPGPGGMIRFEGRVEDAAACVLVSGDATVLEWRPDVPAD